MIAKHQQRNRKLFILTLALMSLLLAGSTRKPETVVENPLPAITTALAGEFTSDMSGEFKKMAAEDPAAMLQYFVSR